MAYLGNAPARSFISFERQVFTIVNSQTAYTLSHSVNNENDIRLVINNVVQEPGSGKAYTASGTTLTLSAALVNGTDEMYCVFLGRAVATNKPGAGSVGTTELTSDAVTGAKIADDAISDEHLDPTAITGQTAETSIADDDLILISDTSASAALKKMTKANFVSGVGGANTPAFMASLSSVQNVSDNVTTKAQVDSELFDTDNAYDNSTNYRFTPQTAGKYVVFGAVFCDPQTASDLVYGRAYIYKNGSFDKYSTIDFRNNAGREVVSFISYIVDMNGSSDYVELYGNVNAADGAGMRFSNNTTYFGAYRIIT